MSRCPSCNNPLDVFEMQKKIKLPDGTLIPEEFCNNCLGNYVSGADYLDTKFYAHEHLTEGKFKYFTKNNE